MRATLWKTAVAGLLTIGSALGLETAPAHAQGFGSRGWDGDNSSGGSCGNGGLPTYNPNLPYSPAQQQDWREGRLYYETGIAPNHPLSPAQARGFVAGERREANSPGISTRPSSRAGAKGRSSRRPASCRIGRCRRASVRGSSPGSGVRLPAAIGPGGEEEPPAPPGRPGVAGGPAGPRARGRGRGGSASGGAPQRARPTALHFDRTS